MGTTRSLIDSGLLFAVISTSGNRESLTDVCRLSGHRTSEHLPLEASRS